MFFKECERLAERHPELAATIRQVDAQLQRMGTAEAIRSAELASFLGADPNRVDSVLNMLVEARILCREDMIECPFCNMVVLRSEYERALDDDGECRCTSCDRPLTTDAVQPVTSYRGGKKWKCGVVPSIPSVYASPNEPAPLSSPAGAVLDDQGWYTHDQIAEAHHLGEDALRKRLERYRESNLGDGWTEKANRGPREKRYLYRYEAIKEIVAELKASSERPAK